MHFAKSQAMAEDVRRRQTFPLINCRLDSESETNTSSHKRKRSETDHKHEDKVSQLKRVRTYSTPNHIGRKRLGANRHLKRARSSDHALLDNERVDNRCGTFCNIVCMCKPDYSQYTITKNWTSGDKHIDEIIRKSQIKDLELIQWIELEEFEDIEPLSEGRDKTSIYTAKWRSSSTKMRPAKTVLLKVMHAGADATAVFLNELANLATKLQENSHRSFPTLHGVTKHAESGDYALVMEYCQDGDMRTYLEKNSSSLSWGKRLELLRAVVQSLKSAHQHEIAHCNLHTGNLLLHSIPDSDTCSAIISDFGLSKALSSTVSDERVSYGILPYMAPESIAGRPCTIATDTYALGMIMWEISAGEPPFSYCSHDMYLKLSICDGARPPTIKGTPECWIKLMERCWQDNPKNRPTLDDVEDEICRWNIDEQFEEAERYRRNQPELPRKKKHPEAHYSSRFIRSITPPETNDDWINDDDWDQTIANMVIKR